MMHKLDSISLKQAHKNLLSIWFLNNKTKVKTEKVSFLSDQNQWKIACMHNDNIYPSGRLSMIKINQSVSNKFISHCKISYRQTLDG